jgi:sirohydrochlorin ferrochelatase
MSKIKNNEYFLTTHSSRLMTAVILVGHGSKQKGFDAPLKKVAKDLVGRKRFASVTCAYLGSCPPSLEEAMEAWVKKGVKEIRVMPYFVLSGMHVTQDIPQIIRKARKKYSRRVKIRLCPYLGYHEKITQVVEERISQAR